MNWIQKLHRLKTVFKTQVLLAAALEISFVTLNTWLQEKSVPRMKYQKKINDLYEDHFGRIQIEKELLETSTKKFHIKKGSFTIHDIKNSSVFLNTLLIKLTYHTNSIEGSTVTESDTAEILQNHTVFPNYSLKEQLEVQNHKKAFLAMLEYVEKPNITADDICFLHSLLMGGILENAGKFRYHPVRILGSGVSTVNYLTIPEKINLFLHYFHKETENDLFHLAKSHADFEQIHPFSDGNGRIGRLLLILLLFRKTYPPIIIPQEKKQAYYMYLQEAQLNGDYDFLCWFFSELFFE